MKIIKVTETHFIIQNSDLSLVVDIYINSENEVMIHSGAQISITRNIFSDDADTMIVTFTGD